MTEYFYFIIITNHHYHLFGRSMNNTAKTVGQHSEATLSFYNNCPQNKA